MKPEVIYCRGGDPAAPRVARLAGLRYGVRHNMKAYSQDIYMVDIDWQRYDWGDYVAKVKRYQPQIAMVADLTHRWLVGRMLEQFAELADIVPRVMVCPKYEGALEHIPSSAIVALSVPTKSTKYKGWLPDDLSQLAGRDVHLLGGSPARQAQTMQRVIEAGARVVSVDGNVIGSMALMGKYWARYGGWVRSPKPIPPDMLAVTSGLNWRAHIWGVASARFQTSPTYGGIAKSDAQIRPHVGGVA